MGHRVRCRCRCRRGAAAGEGVRLWEGVDDMDSEGWIFDETLYDSRLGRYVTHERD